MHICMDEIMAALVALPILGMLVRIKRNDQFIECISLGHWRCCLEIILRSPEDGVTKMCRVQVFSPGRFNIGIGRWK